MMNQLPIRNQSSFPSAPPLSTVTGYPVGPQSFFVEDLPEYHRYPNVDHSSGNAFNHTVRLSQNIITHVDKIDFPQFLSKIYSWMTLGLFTTTVTAGIVATSPVLFPIVASKLGFFLVSVAAVGLNVAISRAEEPKNLQSLFLAESCVFGCLLSVCFLVYSPAVLLQASLFTTIAFFALGVQGLTNPNSLEKYTPALTFGLTCLSLLSLSALLGHLLVMELVMSAVGVVLFSAYILIKHNELNNIYENARTPQELEAHIFKEANDLYLLFLNLLLKVLSIAGQKDDQRKAA